MRKTDIVKVRFEPDLAEGRSSGARGKPTKDVPIRSVMPTASISTPDYAEHSSLVDPAGLPVLLLIPVA